MGQKWPHSRSSEAGHTLYTFVTAPVAMVALLDADVAEGLSLLTYLGLRTADKEMRIV